jgi:tetratricopeptide (TPR) repeat protein
MVEKFIGDAVVAVFGLPVIHEDDALRALRAAVEMRSALGALNEEFEAKWGVALSARTGVNTGTVLVETGATARGHIAVGDAMNLGARLEQTAGPGEILLGEVTYLLVRGMVDVEPTKPLTLKGKARPVRAYRLEQVNPGAESLLRQLDSPMVGRQDDLSALEWAFERTVRDSACRVVTIVGAAGVGKSRLVREFLRGVDDGATVLRGRCLAYGEGITFWPLVEVVRQAAGIAEYDTVEQATEKLAAVLALSEEPAEVALRVAEAVGLSSAVGTAREAFWSVRKLFEALASARPLIVVFDDLHWAEPTFLDLIQDVAMWTRGVPQLILCMTRPELLDARPNWNEPKPFKTMLVSLSPLREADADRLLGTLLGTVELSPRGREAIVEASGGNPLFVEQMSSMLADDGSLMPGGESLATSADVVEVSAPPTIQALLTTRLDRLDGAERRVLERASVVGKVFYTGAVADLAPDEERPATGSHLASLTRKQLVAPGSSDLAGQDAYRFVHGLVRDAAYEGITKARRATLHERFADWLESSAGHRLREYEEILAYHLEQASRYRAELGKLDEHDRAIASRAADRLRSAATRALARGDLPAAINLASRAMSLLDPTDGRQPELLIMAATSLGEQGQFEDERQTLTKALAISTTLKDERLLAHVRLAQARARAFVDSTVSMDEADREAREAIEVFERVGDDLGLAKAWRFRNWVAHNSYQHAEAEAASAKAYEFAHRAGDPSQIGDLSVMSASILYGPTPVREGIRKCEAILERVEGSRGDMGFVLGFLGILHAMDGRPDEGRALIERAAAIAEDLGPSLTSAATRSYWMGVLDVLIGGLPEAERELRRGYEILDGLGETNFRSTLSARLAQVLCALERYEEAERYAEISRDTAGLDDVTSQVLWRGAQAKVLARRGDLEGAETLATEAVALASHTDALNLRADAWMDLATVLRIAEREGDAAEAVQHAFALYEEKGNVVMTGVARGLLHDPDC